MSNASFDRRFYHLMLKYPHATVETRNVASVSFTCDHCGDTIQYGDFFSIAKLDASIQKRACHNDHCAVILCTELR